MSQQGPSDPWAQGQRRTAGQPKTSGRTAGGANPADARSLTDAMGAPAAGGKVTSKTAPAVTADEPVITEGRNGERNLSLLWIDVWIGNIKPCRFDVKTLPDHALEVVVEQAAYRRTYTGTGALSTQPVPVAPLGTKLSVRATDTVTGETMEQTGIWKDMGGGGLLSLWSLIKRLLWKG